MIKKLTSHFRLAMTGLAMVTMLASTMAAHAEDRSTAFDYSGAFAGFSMTYAFGQSNWTDPLAPASTGVFDLAGRGGGAIVGYNWRTGRAYFGLALDITVTPADGTGYGGCATGCDTTLQSYAALRAQLGQRMGDGHLYGFAGLAMGRVDLAPVGFARQERDLGGWLVGIGYEHPLQDGWTFRAELQYMDFEDTRYTLSGPVQTVSDNRVGMLRLGLTRYF
ncbi:outer membrane protein [Nioella ostreopsis]|uniref:outer membrane protein n=1 Tax=Nioella ostreopsis TaxID=2448479 RepID=UPI000FD6E938|nr:outer membrane beta-barrel protein [Nioella ostreopsis]